MQILPSIDILDGKVVRLAQGDYNKVTVYGDDPLQQARDFAELGANWVHVVDLEGARSGEPTPEMFRLIRRIAFKTGLKVQVGGGIRDIDTLAKYVKAGATRIVMGAAIVKDPEMVAYATTIFGGNIVADVAAKDGQVYIEGWREGAGMPVMEFCEGIANLGVRHMVFTDIDRDGMQKGIDAAFYKKLSDLTHLSICASGGVSSLGDLKALEAVEVVSGVIVGRAIYEGSLKLDSAVKLLESLAAIREASHSCGGSCSSCNGCDTVDDLVAQIDKIKV